MTDTTCQGCGTPLVRTLSRQRGACSECDNRMKFPDAWAVIDNRRWVPRLNV
jgi:uncharacterized Zn finger protein (UPF0148 family)